MYVSETYILYWVCFVGKDWSLRLVLSRQNAVQGDLFPTECTKGIEKELYHSQNLELRVTLT